MLSLLIPTWVFKLSLSEKFKILNSVCIFVPAFEVNSRHSYPFNNTVFTQADLRGRAKDNIKMYFHEVGWGGMDWIPLMQDRDRLRALVNAVMNLRVP